MATERKSKSKKVIINILSVALLIIAVVGLVGYAYPAYKNAEILGAGMGDATGTIVGKVVGSFRGITVGLEEGKEAGREEGLSAQDTESQIKNSFSEIGNLEVLEAGVKLNNVNTIGDDYAALYLLKGMAVYSVNLKEIEIVPQDSGTLEIFLPNVTVDLFIDETATEQLAEYQKHPWSKSTEDGFVAYMNSMEAIDQSVESTMGDYAALLEAAQSSAITQVKKIAEAATGNKKEIIVTFKEEQTDE